MFCWDSFWFLRFCLSLWKFCLNFNWFNTQLWSRVLINWCQKKRRGATLVFCSKSYDLCFNFFNFDVEICLNFVIVVCYDFNLVHIYVDKGMFWCAGIKVCDKCTWLSSKTGFWHMISGLMFENQLTACFNYQLMRLKNCQVIVSFECVFFFNFQRWFLNFVFFFKLFDCGILNYEKLWHMQSSWYMICLI